MNRREAIRQKCYQCSSDEWKEVRDCKKKDCALFPFRTGKELQDPKERDKAIKAECMDCMNRQPWLISNCGDDCPLHEFHGYTR